MTVNYTDIINNDNPLWYYPLQDVSGPNLMESNGKSFATSTSIVCETKMDNTAIFNGIKFDGTNSTIVLPFTTNFLEFSISFWLIPLTGSQSGGSVIGHRDFIVFPFSISLSQDGTQLTFSLDTGKDTLTDLNLVVNVIPDKLYHIGFTRNSISGLNSIYLNGILVSTGILIGTLAFYSGNWMIGTSNEYGGGVGTSKGKFIISHVSFFDYVLTNVQFQNHYWNGISNVYVNDSSTVNDEHFNKVELLTHCEQLNTIADPYLKNVCLLLHFNGQNNTSEFKDVTNKQIVPIGNAYMSTTQKKFGTSSGYFNSDSKLHITHKDFNFGLNDFTIEFCFYLPTTITVDNFSYMFDFRNNVTPNGGLYCYVDSNMILKVVANGITISCNTTLTINNWYSIVVCRDGEAVTIFNNGIIDIVSPMSVVLSNDTLNIGGPYQYQGNPSFPVYIDEFRVTRLLSRYRYDCDISVPISEFQYQIDSTYDGYSGYTTLSMDFNYPKICELARNAIVIPVNFTLSKNQIKSGTSSGYFNGVNSYIELANIVDYNLSHFDFTIELDIHLIGHSNTGNSILVAKGSEFTFYITETTITIQGFNTNSNQSIVGAFIFQLNTWYNIAISRIGNDLFIYVDGNIVNTQSFFDIELNITNSPLRIGGNTEHFFNGYIDNFRITRGISKYNKRYVPMKLLPIFQQGITSNKSLQFNTTQRYISSSIKRFKKTSMLFNNSNGYYDKQIDFSNKDFTIELWYYKIANGEINSRLIQTSNGSTMSSIALIDNVNGSLSFACSIDGTTWANGTYPQICTLVLGVWNHIAITRCAGDVSVWINGISMYSYNIGTSSLYFNSSTDKIYIGGVPGNSIHGYIDDIRITLGVARYNNNFTIPQFEFPDSTTYTHYYNKYDMNFKQVAFLLGGTNTIIDCSVNNIELVLYGNSIALTTEKTVFGKSIKSTNQSDYIVTNARQELRFNNSDFTIDCWILPMTSSNSILLDGRPTNTNGEYLTIGINDNKLELISGGVIILTSNITIIPLTWNHISITRLNDVITMYIQGIKDTSTIFHNQFKQDRFIILASAYNTGVSNTFIGFIEDLRISLGICRYIGNFELPTSSYLKSSDLAWTPFTPIVNDPNDIVITFPMNWVNNEVLDPDNILISFAGYKFTGKALKDDYTPASLVSIHSEDGTEYYTQIPEQVTGAYSFSNLHYKLYYITVDSSGDYLPHTIGPVYPDLM